MSEKDQDSFVKEHPFEGAPQFDVTAPDFVPKDEAENLVETPNLETDTVVEVTREPVTPASLEGKTAFEANPGVTPSPQPSTSPVVPPTVPPTQGPTMQVPQAPVFPVRQGMNPADKKAIQVALGIVVGLLIGGVSGYLIGHAKPSSTQPSSHQEASFDREEDSSDGVDLSQLVTEDNSKAKFELQQEDLGNLQFSTDSDQGETPEDTVKSYGKANYIQFENGELELRWGDDLYTDKTAAKATYTKKGDRFELTKIDFGYYALKQDIEDKKIDDLKEGDSATGKGGSSYKELLKDNADNIAMSIESSDYSDTVELTMNLQKKNGDYVDLTFIRQSDGDFLLSRKESY